MTDCPAEAEAHPNGHLLCHLTEGHTGTHWDQWKRAWWSVQIDYDFDDDRSTP